jgi:hypothetical protein
MSTIVKTFRKHAVERRQLVVDYSCWLQELETLTGFQVLIEPLTEEAPLTVTIAYSNVEQTKLAMYVSGGKGNNGYIVQLMVTTDLGQLKRDDIGVRVTP